jgi:hypothetical protein
VGKIEKDSASAEREQRKRREEESAVLCETFWGRDGRDGAECVCVEERVCVREIERKKGKKGGERPVLSSRSFLNLSAPHISQILH